MATVPAATVPPAGDQPQKLPLKTSDGDELLIIGPEVSYVIGFGISLLLGILVGCVGFWACAVLHQPAIGSICFFIVGGMTVGYIFQSGLGGSIPTQNVGVPRLFGRRIDHLPFMTRELVCSEGNGWSKDRLWDYLPVDIHVKTTASFQIEGTATDNVDLSAAMAIKYQVTRPFQNLNTEEQIPAIIAYAKSDSKDVIQGDSSDNLRLPETKSSLGKRVTDVLQPLATKQYGIGVIQAIPGPLEYTAEYRAALEAKKIRQRNLEADDLEIEKIDLWIERLTKHGLAPELAAEIAQTQTGKSTSNRIINRYEGLQSIAETIAAVAKEVIQELAQRRSST